MSVYEPIHYWGQATPTRSAFMFPGGVVSYGELHNAVNAATVAIARAGFRPGGLVNVSVVNPVFQFIIFLSLGRLNIPFISMRSAAGAADLNIKLAGEIADSPQGPQAGLRRLTVDHNWFVSKLGAANPPAPDHIEVGDEQPLRYVVTSGSTGSPKAVELTHGNFEARLKAATLHPDSGRNLVLVHPASSWGYLLVLKTLRSGGSFCFAPFPDDALDLCDMVAAETICASVAQAATLLDEQIKRPRELRSVKRLFIGGSLVSDDLLQRLQKHVCRNIGIGYGASETGQAASAPVDSLAGIPGAVGFLHPGVRLQIVDESDRPVPPGVSGIVRIASAGSGKAYTKTNDEVEGVFRGDWFYPGDIGSLTKTGMLIIEGRSSETILNKGGQKIVAMQLEGSIKTYTKAADVAVLSGASEAGVPEIWAAIASSEAFNPEKLRKELEEKLGASAPDRLFKVDRIPRSDNGKIQYKELRSKLASLGN